MLYTIMAFSAIGGFLTFGSWRLLKIKSIKDEKVRDEEVLSMIQGILRKVLKKAHVTYTVIGEENLPTDEAVLYVGNHRSYFDVVISLVMLKQPAGYIAKVIMEKYLTLATWMRYLHCQFMDRKNTKQSLKVVINAIKLIKAGTSMFIYPEGTRSKTDDPKDMLEFKEGSFKIAEKAGCRIVPIAMINTRELLEAHMPIIEPGHVYVRVGEPIDIKTLSDEEKKHIGSYTRNKMIEYIKELEAIEEKDRTEA